MKTFYTFLALTLIAGTASAARNVNETLDAAADGTVSISNVTGSIEVSGWSQNRVEVKGRLDDNVEELQFERDGDEILIKVKVPRSRSSNTDAYLVIRIPEDSNLEINTVSADIDVRGVRGQQDLEAVSGDIDTQAYAEDIQLETVSGDIEVEGSSERMRSLLSSVSGDIEVTELVGEIDIDTVNGDLSVTAGRFSRVRAETVNGSILVHAGLDNGGRLDVETVNGSVDIDFGDDVSARFEIETFNGSIRNCFGPDPVRTSKYTPGRELKFTEGGGTGRVSIQTLNGGIRLCK